MATIELYGLEVIPRVRELLAAARDADDLRGLTAQARAPLIAD
jgi:hypothetical protein